MTKTRILFGLAILVFGHLDRLAASEFYHFDELVGAAHSRMTNASADGSTFVGWTYDELGELPPSLFVWSDRTGLVHLENPVAGDYWPLGVSRDGSRVWTQTIAGSCTEPPHDGGGEVLEWTMEGGSRPIGISYSCTPEGKYSFTHVAVSVDGQAFVGFDQTNNSIKRFSATEDVYTEQTLLTDFGLAPYHVSADGSVIVFGPGAWRWSEDTGETIGLGILPDYRGNTFEIFANQGIIASADGSVVVGFAFNGPDLLNQAFRWTAETGMVGLGFIEEHVNNAAYTVSPDGQLVLGYSSGFGIPAIAFVWDEAHGMRGVQRLLTDEFGLAAELDGVRLFVATGISEDRQVVYGVFPTRGISGMYEMWVARLDRPLVAFTPSDVVGDLTNDRVVDIQDIDVLRSAIRDGSTELPYDLNGSGSVEIGDLTALIHGALNTWFGDANLDGEFSSSDLVTVFQAGQYEDEIVGNSTWETGDWNADGDFTTSDLVAAFQDGGYEQGPRAAINSVPEPSSLGTTLLISLALAHRRRRAASL